MAGGGGRGRGGDEGQHDSTVPGWHRQPSREEGPTHTDGGRCEGKTARGCVGGCMRMMHVCGVVCVCSPAPSKAFRLLAFLARLDGLLSIGMHTRPPPPPEIYYYLPTTTKNRRGTSRSQCSAAAAREPCLPCFRRRVVSPTERPTDRYRYGHAGCGLQRER